MPPPPPHPLTAKMPSGAPQVLAPVPDTSVAPRTAAIAEIPTAAGISSDAPANQVLPYQTPPRRGDLASSLRILVMAISSIALAPVHFFYLCDVSLHLWEFSGGIKHAGLWTRFGTSDWGWSTPIDIPVGVLCWAGAGPLAMLWLMVGSIVGGISLADLSTRLAWRVRKPMGRGYWRLWQMALPSHLDH